MSATITPQYAVIPASAVQTQPYGWGTLGFLADANGGASPHVSMALVTIAAGKRNILHRHSNCDELLHLLKGRLRHLAGDRWIVINPGDTIRISRGVIHQAEVISDEDAEMIVVYSAGRRETEVLAEGG